jgi:hypothetical protein
MVALAADGRRIRNRAHEHIHLEQHSFPPRTLRADGKPSSIPTNGFGFFWRQIFVIVLVIGSGAVFLDKRSHSRERSVALL